MPTAKQSKDIEKKVIAIITERGAVATTAHHYPYELNTSLGLLRISIDEGAIFCRFEDVARAKEGISDERLNRFSGKWNWEIHFQIDKLSDFTRSLDSICGQPEKSVNEPFESVSP